MENITSLVSVVDYEMLTNRLRPMLCLLKATARNYSSYLLTSKGVAAVTDGMAILYTPVMYSETACFDKDFKKVENAKAPNFTDVINRVDWDKDHSVDIVNEFLKLQYKTKTPTLTLVLGDSAPFIGHSVNGYSLARIQQFLKGIPKDAKLQAVKTSKQGFLKLQFEFHAILLCEVKHD